MTELKNQQCVPCRGGVQTLGHEDIEMLRPRVPKWSVIEEEGTGKLRRRFKFTNFAQALEFTVKVGHEAQEEDHHPAILTEWGAVTVTWWTHSIGGLHRNDFIMAARTDEVFASFSTN
jgi:4a-hydroxytetrahydrobiopterin dehydratase